MLRFPSAKWGEKFLLCAFLKQELIEKNMGNYLGKEFDICGPKVKYNVK